MARDTIGAALRRLEMSDGEQQVYLSLLREGRATARMLADRTGLTRPSVYDQLKKLIATNLVVELDVNGKAYFAAGDIKYLDALLLDKIDRLEQSRQFLAEALPNIGTKFDTVVPKIRFFEGEEGLKQLLKDVMWHDRIMMSVVWNEIEMGKIYDQAFLRWWNDRRLLRQIGINWQVFSDNKSKRKMTATSDSRPSFFASHIDFITPLVATAVPKMTRLIYANKVACISSPQEAFGFIVESSEFNQLQQLSL